MERKLLRKITTQRRLEDLPGKEYFKENLLVLKAAHSIYFKNYFDWKKVCDEFRNVDNTLRFNDPWRWRKQKAIIRSFHNLIVSFQSYHDHIKGFIKKPDTSSRLYEIKNKHDRLCKEEISCFVRVLRNMMVHRQVYPLVSKGVSLESSNKIDSGFYRYQSIRRVDLENYISSSPPRRKNQDTERRVIEEFLQKQPADIDIEWVVDQQFNSLNNFHKER